MLKQLKWMVWLVLIACLPNFALAQDPPKVREIVLAPQAVSRNVGQYRLLPTEPELKDGNGVVLMLRCIWEQQSFMEKVAPKLQELLELPPNDPRVKDVGMSGLYRHLHRAAYQRHSTWEYPVHDEPLAGILLPDLQGLRNIVGRGLAVQARQQIEEGKFEDALETLRTQLGCSRHIAKANFLVSYLISLAVAEHALDQVEFWSSKSGAPNLYWALALLPDSLGSIEDQLQWEAAMLERSLPSLRNGWPAEDDATGWGKASKEFSDLMLMSMQPLSQAEGLALQTRMVVAAHSGLKQDYSYTDERLAKMSPQAQVMIWILKVTSEINGEVEAAYTLSPSEALERLRTVEARANKIVDEIKAPEAPFNRKMVGPYIRVASFDRRAKFLQVVESIRDYAASHNNQLPKNLEELTLPAPRDPLTEQPFEYSVQDGVATLKMAKIEGDTHQHKGTELKLRIAEK